MQELSVSAFYSGMPLGVNYYTHVWIAIEKSPNESLCVTQRKETWVASYLSTKRVEEVAVGVSNQFNLEPMFRIPVFSILDGMVGDIKNFSYGE